MTPIDTYIQNSPPEHRERLELIRRLVKEIVPLAEEKIAWQMPTLFIEKKRFHYACAKNHIGFYLGAQAVIDFSEDCQKLGLKTSKGAMRLAHSQDLPVGFIQKLVRYVFLEDRESIH
ncbi:MAG: iron chaperone [Brevinema sp.]